ncbi:MAG: LysR family transcriptional regulator [Lautropia sp.]
MPDLNLLLVFEAMLLHQNVTVAAGHIGLTQSAMSNALGRLRRQFDDPLFVNTGSGMLATPRALELSRPLMQALTLIRSATKREKRFDAQQSRRTFRFHMTDIGEMVFLPPLVQRLDELGVGVRVESAQLDSREIVERLESGEIDFAAGYLPSLTRSVQHAALYRERYVCMTRKGHPMLRRGGMNADNFKSATHVLIESLGSDHRNIERSFAANGIKREFTLRVQHYMVIPMIVSTTDRVVTLPGGAARALSSLAAARIHPLPIEIPDFNVSLFWHTRFAEDPPIRWMRELFVDLFSTWARPI